MDANAIVPLIMRHVEAENAHDLEATLATLHPDCVFEDVAFGRVYHGRAGAAEYYRSWWDAFGLEFRRATEEGPHFTSSGMVVGEGRFVGRHTGTFEGLAPTGRQVEFRFVVVVSFRDGLMAGERFYYDRATLMSQIGAWSSP